MVKQCLKAFEMGEIPARGGPRRLGSQAPDPDGQSVKCGAPAPAYRPVRPTYLLCLVNGALARGYVQSYSPGNRPSSVG